MVICSLDDLKISLNEKETGIEKKIVEVSQQASDRRKVKHWNGEILGIDLAFVG